MDPIEMKISLTSDVIRVPADALWSIVGPGFADVADWTSSVQRSVSIGSPQLQGAPCTERACHVNISGYDKISERLTHYDEANRQLAYEVTDGVPGFVRMARNQWTIRAAGDGCSVAEMTCTLRLTPVMGMLVGPLMKSKVKSNLVQVFRELKTFAETGQALVEAPDFAPGTTHRSRVIQASASEVWSVVGEFHDVHAFHPFVESVDTLAEVHRGVGASRRCNLYNESSLVETVVEWDEGRSFTVLASHQPLIGQVTGGMRVDPIDATTSRVTVHTAYTPAWGVFGRVLDILALRRGVTYALKRVLKSLQHHVETGERIGRGGAPVPLPLQALASK